MSKKKLGDLKFSGSVHALSAYVGDELVAELVSDKGWSVTSGAGKGFYGSVGKAKEGVAKALSAAVAS